MCYIFMLSWMKAYRYGSDWSDILMLEYFKVSIIPFICSIVNSICTIYRIIINQLLQKIVKLFLLYASMM